jgi:hypothetical protein
VAPTAKPSPHRRRRSALPWPCARPACDEGAWVVNTKVAFRSRVKPPGTKITRRRSRTRPQSQTGTAPRPPTSPSFREILRSPKHAGFLLFWQPTIQIICDAPFYFGDRQALGDLVTRRIKLRSANALRFQGRGFRSKYRVHGSVCRSFLAALLQRRCATATTTKAPSR